MKTAQLQSLKARTKTDINAAQATIKFNRTRVRALLRNIAATKRLLVKKVDQQRQIKADISAAKTIRAPGSRRKHNKTDPRYVAWYTAQHAERNEDTGGAAPAVNLLIDVPQAATCAC